VTRPPCERYIARLISDLLGKKPIFGICLGHQILGDRAWAPRPTR
jgi:carbamoylphosphate synthase small subunit